MLRKFLLGGTALTAAAVSATLAHAGAVGSGDDLSVTISGEYRFNAAFLDQDLSTGFGRGYSFKGEEAEIKISSKNTADNGLEYGVVIELNTLTDDVDASDEVYAFVDSDGWGRVEMGDQDDVTDQMFIDAADVMVGRAGFDGDVADFFQFGSGGGIAEAGNDETSDATKVSYFTPRIGGFEFGASLTPDDGQNGLSAQETDNDGNYENVVGLAANYVAAFDNVKVALSVTGEFGESESSTGAADEGDLNTISVGGSVEFEGFAVGAGYVDFAEKGQKNTNIVTGENSGSYWDVAAAYKSGPWGISLGYFSSEKGQPAGKGGDTKIDIVSLDGEYNVAPGWWLAVSVNFVQADNVNATATPVSNDGSVVILNNTFKF